MICRFEISDLDFGFGFDTPCLVYDKGGGFNRSAHSARPGQGSREQGTGKSEEGTGRREAGRGKREE